VSSDLTPLLSSAARGRIVRPSDPPTPVTFDFDAGWPAPEAFPIDDFKRLAPAVLADPTALGYRSVRHDSSSGLTTYHSRDFPGRQEMSFGYTGLREQVARWISGREGVQGLTADNVILTSGATQAIALAAAAFIDPGEGALVEALTYTYAFKSLELRGADVRRVALDEHGLVIESLEERLHELRAAGVRPKLLYTIPSFHLPTGTVLPLERRKQLLALADEWDLVVVEDAMYSHFHYDGDPVPPSLFNLDTSGRVLQTHSFSKIIAPGLRIGWICGPPDVIGALAGVREDLGVSQWLARVVAEFMAEGRLDPLIEAANGIYRGKRDIAGAALREHAGELVRFTIPHGGFYLWVALHEDVDWQRAELEAAELGVAVRSADAFRQEGSSRHFRLGFGHSSETELREGIRLLGTALAASVRTPL
jgi:2-aminoadipate transaminase